MKQLLLLTLLILSLTANTTVYYFSSAGSDGNNGTSTATPWKTIDKFNSFITSAVAGDQFLFNKGESFYGQLYINKAGTVGSKIIIGAYGTGANPIITGFITVSEWIYLGGRIWESVNAVSTLSTLNMVLINGVNYPMGRYPNTGYLPYSASTSTSKTVVGLPSATTNWTGAQIVHRSHHWITNPDVISAHSGNVLTHALTPNSTTYSGIVGYGVFIQNDVRTLDTINEWYYNPSTKKLRIFSSSCVPEGVQVSTIDTLVRMPNNRGNITIENMKFTGSNKDHLTIIACPNVTIQNCQFDYAGIDAIWGGANGGSPFSDNFQFLNNTVDHTNNNAILLREEFTDATIEGNTITNTAMYPGMGKGGDGQSMAIRVQAAGATIRYNQIHNTGYVAIYNLGNNIDIGYNFITKWNQSKMDGGGIYSWVGTGTVPTGNRWHHNILLDSRPSTAGTTQTNGLSHAIYLDWNVSNVQVDSNSAAGFGYSCLYIYSGNKNNNIFGNTFFDADNTVVLYANGSSGGVTDDNTFTDNIYVAKTTSQRIYRVNTNGTLAAFIPSFGTWTNNWYCRPMDDVTAPSGSGVGPILVTSNSGGTFNYYNLATWKTATSNEVGSSKSLAFALVVEDMRFEYNETAVPKPVSLGANTYKDVKGTTYTVSVTLAPYTSKVLIKQ